MRASRVKPAMIAAQPSWQVACDRVTAAVTRMGCHMAPVRFKLGRKTIEPFSVAPWAGEKLAGDTPPILKALRGDFFCAPFGGNETACRGESHPLHGEPANGQWRFEALEETDGRALLHLSLATKIREGRVDKFIQLQPGQTAVYSRHVLSGMDGRMSLGHHAMLRFPGPEGSGRISTSRILFGQVVPKDLEDPAAGGYSSLKTGAVFRRLDRVPSAFGGTADVSRYPARAGFEDLLMLVHKARSDFAWTAVAFPSEGYAWYALKDPRVLQSTVVWISNGGRHYPPWNGRHRRVMGLEDVTAYFHFGLAESEAKNPVNRRGFATSVALHPEAPFTVNYIMGVTAIPGDFRAVKAIRRTTGGIVLISSNGESVETSVDTSFLYQNQRL